MKDDITPPALQEKLLAESTLCTVLQLDADRIEVQIGAAVVRLSPRDLASLTGTLQRVVRRVFVPTPRRDPSHLQVIQGGKA